MGEAVDLAGIGIAAHHAGTSGNEGRGVVPGELQRPPEDLRLPIFQRLGLKRHGHVGSASEDAPHAGVAPVARKFHERIAAGMGKFVVVESVRGNEGAVPAEFDVIHEIPVVGRGGPLGESGKSGVL